MDVCVQVELTKPPEQKHQAEMRTSAMIMTKDKNSVSISIVKDKNALLAEFVMPVARQMDVVEKIRRTFSLDMEDYNTQTVWFPKRNKIPSKSA